MITKWIRIELERCLPQAVELGRGQCPLSALNLPRPLLLWYFILNIYDYAYLHLGGCYDGLTCASLGGHCVKNSFHRVHTYVFSPPYEFGNVDAIHLT